MAEVEHADTVAGRRYHLQWLEGCVDWDNIGEAGDELPGGASLQATFRRGWYFGSEAFREKLLKALGREGRSLADKRRSGYTGAQTRDHGETEAERAVSLAQEEMSVTDWNSLKKGDWRKGLVAIFIRKRSLVDNGWLAERLAMGARTAVSRIMGQARERMQKDRKVKTLARRLEKKITKS